MGSEAVLNASFLTFDGGIQKLDGEDTAVILLFVFSSICAIGLGGNGLVLVMLINSAKVKKKEAEMTVMLLANLTVADTLILAVCSSARALTYHKRAWTLGIVTCRTIEWFQHSCLTAKSLTLAVLSKMRCDVDPRPRNGTAIQVKRMLLVAGSIWGVGLLFPIVDVFFSKLHMEGNFTLCVTELPPYFSDFMRVYSKILPLVVYVVPLIFSAVCQVRAVVRIPKSHGERAEYRARSTEYRAERAEYRDESAEYRIESAESRTQSCLALLSVTAVNALLLLPEWSTWMWMRNHAGDSCKPPAAVLVLAQVCTYLASASSPAILLSMLGWLREGLVNLTSRDPSHAEDKMRAAFAVQTDTLSQTLPDLEHFWTGRRNTAVPDNTHPFPWDELEPTADL